MNIEKIKIEVGVVKPPRCNRAAAEVVFGVAGGIAGQMAVRRLNNSNRR